MREGCGLVCRLRAVGRSRMQRRALGWRSVTTRGELKPKNDDHSLCIFGHGLSFGML